ncbi:MAG: hypothetical protein M3Y25_07620 [Thermoproteota archaeon]|nr:hypothetical protein [Thermoproteota archaeon]
MNKRLITMGLIGGTAIVTSLGIALPELYTGVASMGIGGASLFSALQVYKESARRKINKMLLEELR